MDPKHKELLGPSGGDDADARGEHHYPGDRRKEDRLLQRGNRDAAVQRTHYTAGADGTQEIAQPEEARPTDNEEDRE